MEDAKAAAWVRFSRGHEAEEVTKIQDAAGGMCVGTDVRGPEFAEHLLQTMNGLIDRIERGEDAYSVTLGALARLFWVGFEFGKAEER